MSDVTSWPTLGHAPTATSTWRGPDVARPGGGASSVAYTVLAVGAAVAAVYFFSRATELIGPDHRPLPGWLLGAIALFVAVGSTTIVVRRRIRGDDHDFQLEDDQT